MFSRLRTSVAANPVVHLVLAAVIGAVLPILIPAVENQALTVDVAKSAAYAAGAAALRLLFLLVPAKG